MFLPIILQNKITNSTLMNCFHPERLNTAAQKSYCMDLDLL